MRREARTITVMMHLYCRARHSHDHNALCPACADLLRYALRRLRHCPFQEQKSTCARCPVHCYGQEKRSRIKTVMRYAGLRLLWRHPCLSVLHFVDGLRSGDNRKHRKP